MVWICPSAERESGYTMAGRRGGQFCRAELPEQCWDWRWRRRRRSLACCLPMSPGGLGRLRAGVRAGVRVRLRARAHCGLRERLEEPPQWGGLGREEGGREEESCGINIHCGPLSADTLTQWQESLPHFTTNN